MPTSLLIDNWTLQDVESLLAGDVGDAKVGEIYLSQDRETHDFSSGLEATVRIDALLTLLTNVVCFDNLHIDNGFVNTWKRDVSQLTPLENLGVLGLVDYSKFDRQRRELSSVMLNELCVTPSLRAAMQRIQEEWATTRESSDPHLSALVWGTAGMFARSHITATPYFGHPLRRRLIAETRMFVPRSSAAEQFDAFVRTQRTKMFRYRAERLSGTFSHLVLPPFAVQIIEEASCLEDLVPVALQIRDQNLPLRHWLSDYQAAIDEEDEKRQIKFEATLMSVARSIEAKYGADKSGSIGFSLSTAFFKFDVPKSLVDAMRNSIGIRATLSKMVLTPRGHKAMEKLLAMLSVGGTSLGRDVSTALRARYAA